MARLFEQGRLSDADIASEVGEVVAGVKPGRLTQTERILIVPIGLGSLDIAVAHKALMKAVENGVGQQFSFST